MSTSDFAVVSWSSPTVDAAPTDRRSPTDVVLGIDRIDRRPDDVFGDAREAPGDDRIFEIVELICHNVAAGKGLGLRQKADPDRSIRRKTFADNSVDECGLRSNRNLDQIIDLISDS